MIEDRVSRSPLESLGYSFKKEKVVKNTNENRKKKGEEKKNKPSGTNLNEYSYRFLTKIQLFFFCISLFLIPISLFPLEWNMFEYGRVFVLIVFTIILLSLELIKFLIRGKLEIYKSPRDITLLLLTFSFLISYIFSSDSLISFWGYEHRLGTGLISIIAILIYVFILKSMIKNIASVVSLVFSLTLGLLFSAILSIVSFYGFNPFGFIPAFEKFFLVGLPLFNSAKLSIVIWSVGILLSFFVFYNYFQLFNNDESYLNKKLSLSKAYTKKRAIQIFLFLCLLFAIGIFVLSISLFSIKNLLWIGAISLLAVILILTFLSFVSGSKIIKITSALVLITIFSIFGFTRLPIAQNILSIDSDNLVEQVTLDNEAIWGITAASLSESFSSSLVGLGNDNFVVAYSLYRPAFSDDIDLNFVNYSYANNEIYNIVANRGLVGLFVWFVVGLIILKQLLHYLTDEKRKKMLDPTSIENVGVVILDLLVVFVFISAFFSYYSFIMYFILFLLLVLSSLAKNIAYKMQSESLVIQTNFFVEKIGLVKNESIPKFLIFLISFCSIFLIYYVLNDFASRVHAVRAESVIYDIEGDIEERDAIFKEAMNHYDEAIQKNPENYVFRRRVSMILMEYVNNVLAQEFTNLTEDEQRQEFVHIVGVFAQAAIEDSKKSTDLAPTVAVNWNNRDSIYSDLVKMGFHNYVNSALEVSNETIGRNPNNYNSYVNKATYLYLLGNTEGAIGQVRRALEINAYNIPALVMAGEISMALQDYPNAKTYFTNAQVLLADLDMNRADVRNIYEQVSTNLEYLENLQFEAFNIEELKQEIEELETEEIPEESLGLPDEEISD